MPAKTETEPTEPKLATTSEGLELVANRLHLRGDFSALVRRTSQQALAREPLIRAIRVKGVPGPITVVDATAGLGEDSFIIAASGANVIMFERDEKIAALTRDALERARADERTAAIASRMSLIAADSIAGLAALEGAPNAVYLDPMFPEKRKAALTNKKLQLFRMLEAPCENEAELLEAALSAATKKVVVKRPAKGTYLADRKPSYTLAGKTIRFDVYTV